MSEPRPEETPAAAETGAAPAAPLPSPGALLRQARERAGIGAEDLAGQLKLAKGTLEALERDDFAALSEPVYVRGYYRKIAKLLPIKESELIDAYNARSKPAKAVPAMQRIPLAGGVDAGASRHYRGQGIGIAVAIVVVAVILFVLADRQPPPRLAEPPAAETAAPPAAEPPAETAPAPAPGATAAPASGVTAVPAPAQPSPAPARAPAPAPAAKAAPQATQPAAPAAAPPAGAPATVANQLVMDFTESSFVRVEDSRGKTLAIGLVRAGERQALDGQPPYTVFLGNARNVKLWFAGQSVDFTAHINQQNDTARFTVP